jgi:hypothetical protein
MEATRTSGPRYEALKRVMEGERLERKKAQRTRILFECFLGVWIILPVLLWPSPSRGFGSPEYYRTPTPYERHLWELGRGGLLNSPAGLQWIDAGYLAIDRPLEVAGSHLEEGVFPTASSQAVGLRIHVPEGQRLTLHVDGIEGPPPDLFLDLFRAAPERSRRPVPVKGGEMDAGSWTFDSEAGQDYIVRLQPGLAEGGSYRLSLRVGARFLFPVATADRQDIGSVFGDPRDGGRREHHGVDIFHPRGTPVLAGADGTISSVRETGLGGKVVWQREAEGSHSLYYAHLDEQLVRRGQRVRQGDTIGLVGNTGNARTTPPHLHFGVYRRGRGPVDPWDLLFPMAPSLPTLSADRGLVGGWARTTGAGVRLRESPSIGGAAVAELPAGARVRVLSALGGWYRVGFPGASTGYIHADRLEAMRPF